MSNNGKVMEFELKFSKKIKDNSTIVFKWKDIKVIRDVFSFCY